MNSLNNLHSLASSVLRGTRGLFATDEVATMPGLRLELYEYEACPFCRKVREVLSELDLEYVSRPAARGSFRRAAVMERGGRMMVPYLVDPNTGTELYESEDIIDYLHRTYGRGRSSLSGALSPLNTVTAAAASMIRPYGRRVTQARSAELPELIELYNFEASPYCRKVREALSELDIAYVVHNVAKRSRRRPELIARGGRMMVPYLIDPNTGTELYESDDIVAYLQATWGGAA